MLGTFLASISQSRATAGSVPIRPRASAASFARAVPVKRGRIDVATNWKYALDTYGEGYHFATLHPSTIGDQVTSNVMIYDTFGPHHRCGFPRKDLSDLVGTPPESWPAPAYGGIHLRQEEWLKS